MSQQAAGGVAPAAGPGDGRVRRAPDGTARSSLNDHFTGSPWPALEVLRTATLEVLARLERALAVSA